MKEGGLDASFFIVYVGQGPLTPEGYDNAYKQAVAKFDAVHHLTKEIAPGTDRAGAHRRRRHAHREVREEGRADWHRERLFARHRHQARQGVLRSRRPLHVARAQRPQPVRRLEHRRARRQVAAQRPQRDGQAGHRRDEQVGDHGRSLASLEGRQHAGAGAVEGAGDRVAFRRARARRRQPQHGRRAARGAEEERRRDPDGGVRELREGREARFAGTRGGDRGAAQGVRIAGARRRWRAAVAAVAADAAA